MDITDTALGRNVVIQHTVKLTLIRIEDDFALVTYTQHGELFELKLPKHILALDDETTTGWLA